MLVPSGLNPASPTAPGLVGLYHRQRQAVTSVEDPHGTVAAGDDELAAVRAEPGVVGCRARVNRGHRAAIARVPHRHRSASGSNDELAPLWLKLTVE